MPARFALRGFSFEVPMPVPASINDLSTVANDNYPKGNENPFPLNDDHIRAHASFIAQNRDAIATKLNASAVSAFGLTLFDDADAATARATLGIPARYSPGEWVLSCSTTAPTGTLVPNGGTIGSESSGATNRANADTSDLFTVLWNSTSNTDLPIQDSTGAASTRGASAAADFAANKRMPLPNIQDGDALVAAVSSAVLSRTVGEVLAHGHGATVNDPGHWHGLYDRQSAGGGGHLGGGANEWWRGTETAFTGISVSITPTGGAKNRAAGLMTRVYIAL